MSTFFRYGWRRDVIVGGLASVLTSLVLVPIGWASQRRGQEQVDAARTDAQAAARRADEKTAEADEQRALARRAMVERAADFAGFDRSGADVMRVTTDAVSPEVPKDAWLLIDKKASTWTPGDIIVFRHGGGNYLGRVMAVDKAAGRLQVGRNGEKERQIAVADVLGRGVLNTR